MSFVVSLLGLALWASPGMADPGIPSPGTVLPSAPPVPPGRVAPALADPLRAAIDRRTQGDNRAAAWHYESWLAQKGGTARTRAAVQLALGLTWLDLDEPNLASGLFSKVRASGTPVAPWGAWYEAYADHLRGRHSVAARECQAYRTAWPDGEHADECLVLIGDAWVAAGERGPAIAAYNTYLELHPDTPRAETLRLGIALAVTNGSPAQGIPMLQSLVLDHTYHSTGETAQARLDALAADGLVTALPDTVATECRFASERKRCGYETEAWEKFQSLAARASDDPQLAGWVESQQERFAWSTKQYDIVAAQLAEQYAKKPDAETAWQRYRALARGGQWAAAVDQLQAGQKTHGGSSHFRSVRTEVARGQLLAGRYTDAVGSFTELGKTGGAFGKEAKWLAAYAAFRAGTFDDALVRLDGIVSSGADDAMAARYYRARTLDALGRTAEAEAEREGIRAREPMSWYAALTRGLGGSGLGGSGLGAGLAVGGAERWTARDGRWPGPPSPTLPPLKRVATGGVPVAVLASHAPPADRTRAVDWSALAWNAPAANGVAGASAASMAATPAESTPRYEARPDAYRPSFLYDPVAADKLLAELAEDQAAALPWAAAAADLARAGVYRHSAPLMARRYDEIEAAQGQSDPRSVALHRVSFTISEWRNIFLFTRDDHHAARFSWGASKLASNEDQRIQALRYAFPTAQVDALYRHGERYGVDPLLAMGLMRQESVYRQWALSPVGAIGLMQVMPRTGARVAALMGDPHYSPEQLEDPSTNVRYGVWYLSRLLDRFGGAFPLAVASYNGGPHNVSSWLRPWGPNIRVDDYVEQIPYPETRDYVKKVTGYYVTYLALYGPPGGRVVVPDKVMKDDSAVINF
ncbi:MAG: transglycosylase SLT domain-containing protein [Pseudomonadota bacterium]|nr:transglycosylase SLT domain-containing protein [Pseudomonadota bacterium]